MILRGLLVASGLLVGGITLVATSGGDPARSAIDKPLASAGSAWRPTVPPEQRRAYFGMLHIHTSTSYDAWGSGTKVTPALAYAFARGETVMVQSGLVPAAGAAATEPMVPARRAWPLDFMAVTDHAENIGVNASLDLPGSTFARTPLGQRLLRQPGYAIFADWAAEKGVDPPLPAAWSDPKLRADAWENEKKAARDYDRPGIFTTFIGYEWTAMPGGRNLHRNVIFAGADAPAPFTSDQSVKPEDLWTYLENIRARGEDVIAIPHNGNASDGLMYDWNGSDGRPIDEAYAQRRAVNEPLTEIVQIKGQSETHPLISPNDEFAGFELYDHLLASGVEKSRPDGGYVRQAYGRGLIIRSRVGVNPFKYGVVGGSDTHDGLATSDENAMAGGDFGGIDPNTMMPKGRAAQGRIGLTTPPTYWDVLAGTPLAKKLALKTEEQKSARERLADRRSMVELGSSGLTGVWAEENVRGAIFAALKREETFATSGTRIRLRMFGGWDFTTATLRRPDWVKRAYAMGVPMGGDLPARSRDRGAPSFILQAIKDPDGANLDRIQVIKVWIEGGAYRERIFDAALSGGRNADPATGRAPALRGTVDLRTGAYRNTIGAAMLTGIWRDPVFDPSRPAVYYARVLEIPTPRWSTLLAVANGLPLSPLVPPTIQERAWSSPIWFTPLAPANRGR